MVANRRDTRITYDAHLYRERHQVECFINKIKHYRRVFSRFDKLAIRYMGFLSFVAAIIGYDEMSTEPSNLRYYSKIHQKKATPKLQEHILMDLLFV